MLDGQKYFVETKVECKKNMNNEMREGGDTQALV
jgi:hypothetical protein